MEEGSKAHRLYDPLQNKVLVSRDVIFEEGVSWSWNSGEEGTENFRVEEDNLVPINLWEPSETGVVPVEIGAETVENVDDVAGGNLEQSTQNG